MKEDELHYCKAPDSTKVANHGPAVDVCYQTEADKSLLWVGNDEYANTVKYCPFCGFSCEQNKSH